MNRRLGRWVPSLAIAVTGIVITLAAFYFAGHADEARIRGGFDLRAEWRARNFERRLQLAMDSLQAMAIYISVQDKVSVANFREFARLGHDSDDISSGAVWAPLVQGPERSEERRVGKEC